jgi:glucose/arabinose dehydrogenase
LATLKRWQKISLSLVLLTASVLVYGIWYLYTRDAREPSRLAFQDHCAACHGVDLRGTEAAPSLVGRALTYGEGHGELMQAISGHPDMPPSHDWREKLPEKLIKGIALYVSERRQSYVSTAASYKFAPQGTQNQQSEHHAFAVERAVTLHSRPYSLAALPDGRLLVAEKTRGLSVIDNGRQEPPVTGTPRVWDTILSVQGAWLNLGIMLDVTLHPDYAQNGWVYISHTDRCWFDCGSILPVTMVRVLRGRIKDNAWVDEEVVWSVHRAHYTPVPDGVAAGRLAFDTDNYLYISIGGKNTYDKLHNLDTPFGKIHRVRDDGSVPSDNPFFVEAEKRDHASTRHTVWSIGHRTGQGLAGHPQTGAIWNSEMGPRGGDEINLIQGGGNYGWPLYTNGLDYNGEWVTIGTDLGLDFPIAETVLPAVDFTPAPALSDLTFYQGAAFPEWNGDALVGSLKAGTLYRVRIENGASVESERLLVNFGRIRDVATGADGAVYVALEHNENGSIWRLSPAAP